MKILVVGAGSIGLLLSSRLALSGQCTVEVVTGREEQAASLKRDGAMFIEGTEQVHVAVDAYTWDELAEHGTGRWDWVILAVKQRQLDRVMRDRLQHLACGGAKLLCFQNGIGHGEFLAESIEPESIYLAVTTEAARKRSDTEVEHTGRGTTTVGPFAEADGRHCLNIEKSLIILLNQAGFVTYSSNVIHSMVWNKVLINSAINPLTAILRIRNGELLESPHCLSLMRSLIDEGSEIVRAAGYSVADDLWERLLEVCRSTASNASSMLQDVTQGKATEVDWINGQIVRQAERLGLRAPAQQSVWSLVKCIGGEKETDYS